MDNKDVIKFQQQQESSASPILFDTNIIQFDIAYVNLKHKATGSKFKMELQMIDKPAVYLASGTWIEKNTTEAVFMGLALAFFGGLMIKCICFSGKERSSAHR